jgi:hypothetical protein
MVERRACEVRLRAERKLGFRVQGRRSDIATSVQPERKSFEEHLEGHGISQTQQSSASDGERSPGNGEILPAPGGMSALWASPSLRSGRALTPALLRGRGAVRLDGLRFAFMFTVKDLKHRNTARPADMLR